MFKKFVIGGTEVSAAFYCFHDPAIEGPRKMVRATTCGILLEGGELFIGISVCSELDQFTKLKGRTGARVHAAGKLEKYLKGRRAPDDIINVAMESGEPTRINLAVQRSCERYQLEKFREMLSERSRIINDLQQQPAAQKLYIEQLERYLEEASVRQ